MKTLLLQVERQREKADCIIRHNDLIVQLGRDYAHQEITRQVSVLKNKKYN